MVATKAKKKKGPDDLEGVKPPGRVGRKLKTISRVLVDGVCALATKDKIPALDVYFAAVGIGYQKLWSVRNRALHNDNPHPDDVYLLEKCEQTQARIEIECMKDWRAGQNGAASLLQALCKRYNVQLRQSYNDSLKLSCRLAMKYMTPDDFVSYMQDIIDYEPGTQLEDDSYGLTVPQLVDPMKKEEN